MLNDSREASCGSTQYHCTSLHTLHAATQWHSQVRLLARLAYSVQTVTLQTNHKRQRAILNAMLTKTCISTNSAGQRRFPFASTTLCRRTANSHHHPCRHPCRRLLRRLLRSSAKRSCPCTSP